MIDRIWAYLRPRLIGRRLHLAVTRNQSAADRLDAAVRELLQR